MNATRRKFLGRAALALGAVCANAGEHDGPRASDDLFDLTSLPKFVDRLPIPRKAGPVGSAASRENPARKIPLYRIDMRQFQAHVHRDLPPTTLWGYGGASPGPTFDVRSGAAVRVDWINNLPAKHLFTVDHTLDGASADQPEVRTVVHLHGGKVGPESDGYPESWIRPGHSASHYYPNRQDATALFYHDHAMGITRLNTAAGLMGLYLIRDEFEDRLSLPRGEYEVPLILVDRSFRTGGQIYYPVSGNPETPWVAAYYGGGILANGKLFPFLEVLPRRYRFRILNSSNGSFYGLSLAPALSFTSPPLPFFQIGGDQGLHSEPSQMEELILGPGERADLVIDFSSSRGKELYLRTKAATIMQLRVSGTPVDDSSQLPSALRPIPPIPESQSVKTRELTLADYQDRLGRSKRMLLNGTRWSMPVTERVVLGSTEIWSFINLTDDSHPIHLHLVRFQILDRTPFDLPTYQLTGKMVMTGPAQKPAAAERGWKDTVRADPLSVTRIIIKFEGFAGRYVWHCHILEHEDNEMMRPYDVVAPG
jgi:spore coat protein A, manganese oxidase